MKNSTVDSKLDSIMNSIKTGTAITAVIAGAIGIGVLVFAYFGNKHIMRNCKEIGLINDQVSWTLRKSHYDRTVSYYNNLLERRDSSYLDRWDWNDFYTAQIERAKYDLSQLQGYYELNKDPDNLKGIDYVKKKLVRLNVELFPIQHPYLAAKIDSLTKLPRELTQGKGR